MCDCVSDFDLHKLPPGWFNEHNRVAHPNSPAGLGGPGQFRFRTLLGTEAESALLPHAEAPIATNLPQDVITLADDEKAKAATTKPPPKVAADLAPEVLYDGKLTLNLLADVQVSETGFGGKTIHGWKQLGDAKSEGTVVKGVATITKFTDTRTWHVTVRTDYYAKPDLPAVYGRGTTTDDKQDGNTTLGFHESCHRNDLLDYFRVNGFPVCLCEVGQTDAVFMKWQNTFKKEVDEYFALAVKNGLNKADEEGDPTMARWEEINGRKSPERQK